MRMLLGALAGVASSDLADALARLRAPCTVIFEADGEVKKKTAGMPGHCDVITPPIAITYARICTSFTLSAPLTTYTA